MPWLHLELKQIHFLLSKRADKFKLSEDNYVVIGVHCIFAKSNNNAVVIKPWRSFLMLSSILLVTWCSDVGKAKLGKHPSMEKHVSYAPFGKLCSLFYIFYMHVFSGFCADLNFKGLRISFSIKTYSVTKKVSFPDSIRPLIFKFLPSVKISETLIDNLARFVKACLWNSWQDSYKDRPDFVRFHKNLSILSKEKPTHVNENNENQLQLRRLVQPS